MSRLGEKRSRSLNIGEKIIEGLLLASAFASVAILSMIFLFLFREGIPTFSEILPEEFFLGTI